MRVNRAIILAQAGQVLGDTGSVTWAKVQTALASLVQNILVLAGLAATGAIVYYGVLMATAGSNTDRYSRARKGLIYAAIGTIIIFGVYTIIATVRGAVNSIGH